MLWPKFLPARSVKNRWSHTKQTVSKRRIEKAVARLRLEDLEDRAVPAVLWTDQPDYAPGTMATLYGNGFAPGETINLSIVSDNGGVGANFSITDGGLRDADKTVDGKFTTSWYVDHSNANAFLSATAIGQFSGLVATTTFTDSGLGTPINITIANGWTPGGDNGTNPVTTVTCPAGSTITKIAIKTGEGGGFVLENLTGIPGDQNTGSMHSPVIVQDGYLGKGNAFSTTPPASGPYYAVSGLGTMTVTVTAVNGAEKFGGGFSHVDYYCNDVPPPPDDPVTLEGRKFNDLNGNGMYDLGEPGIGNWPIQLQVGSYSTTAYTNEEGYYSATFTVSLADIANGIPYYAQEGSQMGWTQTYGNGGYSGIFTLEKEVVSNLDFGNFKNFALEGQKFEDHDGNGMQDSDDQGLPGWTVVLNGPSGMMTAVTDADGNYRFENLGPGSYSVQEEQQGGWTQTYGVGGYTVTGSSGMDSADNDFGNFKNVDINGLKFYDSNTNGIRNLAEPGINGWTFGLDINGDTIPDLTTVTSGTGATGGTFSFTNLGPGTYTVYELNGLTGNWLPTTATSSGPFAASSGMNVNAGDFGNIKLGAGGGLTLGYWSNKNGQATMNNGPGGMSGALSMLTGLNLRNANGSNFDPTSYTQFRTWIINATAENMSYMLSAQMAAMALNVYEGKVSGSSLIYAPGTNSANSYGFATVNAVIAEANTALGANGYTPSGSADRAYQEALKIALDRANNNINFVVSLTGWQDTNGNNVIDPGEI